MDQSEIHTDESPLYKELESRGHIHNSVLHNKRYVDAMGHVHINTAESSHAILKRMHYGTYHKMDRVQEYADENAYRWGHRRENGTAFALLLELVGAGGPVKPEPVSESEPYPPPMSGLDYGQMDLGL